MKELKQNTSFGLVAKQYQKYRRSYDSKLYKLLFSLLPKKELEILDLGCGTGKSTEPILLEAGERKVTVFGLDPDEAMLIEARKSAKKKKLPITYIKGTAENLPFKSEQFNAVISGAAFHWYGNKRTVSKIKSIIKKNGVFFVFWAQYTDSNKETIGSNLYKKYKWQGIQKKFRGQNFVSKLLIEAGFRNVKKTAIPFVEKKTISETIGNLKTNSSYAMMLEETKKVFVKEITKAYKTALGDKKVDTNNLELLICYGYKK